MYIIHFTLLYSTLELIKLKLFYYYFIFIVHNHLIVNNIRVFLRKKFVKKKPS